MVACRKKDENTRQIVFSRLDDDCNFMRSIVRHDFIYSLSLSLHTTSRCTYDDDIERDARFSSFTNIFEVKNDGTYSPVKKFGSLFMNKMSEISEKLFGQACPLNEDPIGSVQTILGDRIVAQEPANRAILDAFTAWNLDREIKDREVKPLVLAFTGPTGVGKTETALSIGDALFRKRDRLQSGRNVPRGLLVRKCSRSLMMTFTHFKKKYSNANRYLEERTTQSKIELQNINVTFEIE